MRYLGHSSIFSHCIMRIAAERDCETLFIIFKIISLSEYVCILYSVVIKAWQIWYASFSYFLSKHENIHTYYFLMLNHAKTLFNNWWPRDHLGATHISSPIIKGFLHPCEKDREHLPFFFTLIDILFALIKYALNSVQNALYVL